MSPHVRHAMRASVPTLLVLGLTASCGSTDRTRPSAGSPQPESIGILAFGDSGYHLDYPDLDEPEGFPTYAEYLADERREWLEDQRPIAEFEPGPAAVVPATGEITRASGLFPVTSAMQRYCAHVAPCDFALMLGDNVYPAGATGGADGRDDTQRLERILREPFAPLVAPAQPGFRIYVALGNHDWATSRVGASTQAEYLARTPPFFMDGFFYRVLPPNADQLVELFIIDTEMLLATVAVPEDALRADGTIVETDEWEEPPAWAQPVDADERGMVQWLTRSLEDSTARWKLVLGHHPIWSSAGSKFQQAAALRALILPPLCRYADMYLAGHDHTLEVHVDDCDGVAGDRVLPLPHVVSGAAAKQRPLHTPFMQQQAKSHPALSTLYARGMIWGFAHVTLAGDAATVRLVSTPNDASGRPEVEFEHAFARRSGS